MRVKKSWASAEMSVGIVGFAEEPICGRSFSVQLKKVEETALGVKVIKGVKPDQMLVRVVNDELVELMGGKKEDYGKLAQTGVSFLGGYIAGIACAVVSHPADVMVSKLNSDRKRESTSTFVNLGPC